jgi:hypothetical protein
MVQMDSPFGRSSRSDLPRNRGQSLRGGDDWKNFELDQVLPKRRPLRDQVRVVAFHDLETPTEVVGDPTCDISETFGCQTPAFPKTLIHRHRVSRPKPLDNHVQHAAADILLPPPPSLTNGSSEAGSARRRRGARSRSGRGSRRGWARGRGKAPPTRRGWGPWEGRKPLPRERSPSHHNRAAADKPARGRSRGENRTGAYLSYVRSGSAARPSPRVGSSAGGRSRVKVRTGRKVCRWRP